MIETEILSSVVLPIVVWLLMFVVGMDLTTADFQRIKRHPAAIALVTALQLLLLPLVAAILIWLLNPRMEIAAGILLVAICPGGSLSNFYSYLAGANTALSITLTAVSSALAVVSVPVLASFWFSQLLGQYEAVEVPVLGMTSQLIILLLVPICIGMIVRHRFADFVLRHDRLLRRLSLLALAGLVLAVLYDQRQHLNAELYDLVLAAVLFSFCALICGWCAGRATRLERADRFAILLEFGVRNLAITAAIGASVLGRVEYLLFAAVFLIVQLPILFVLVAAHKKSSVREA